MLLLLQVWVLDSNVGRVRDDARTDVEKVVEEVAAIPLPVPSRKVRPPSTSKASMCLCIAKARCSVSDSASLLSVNWRMPTFHELCSPTIVRCCVQPRQIGESDGAHLVRAQAGGTRTRAFAG